MSMKEKKHRRSDDSLSGLRFLVVDDHKFSRQIVIEALKWLDASNITEAADGAEALQFLRGTETFDREVFDTDVIAKRLELTDDRVVGRTGYDCVITDFNMQNQSGLDLLKAIRTGEAKCPRDLPVLMLTGFSDDYLIAAALRLDVSAFVLKPIARTVFSEKLGKVLMRPIEPQTVDTYRNVETSDAIEKQEQKNPAHSQEPQAQPAVAPAQERKTERIDIPDIPAGSLLCTDITGPNGAIMVHAGTQLTAILLEKLWELHKMGWIDMALSVQAPPEDSQASKTANA